MIVGVLSDTHGRLERTARALNVLKRAGAEAFIHCGDLGDERVLDHLAGFPAWFVLGNTDGDFDALHQYAATIGVHVPNGVPLHVELGGKTLAVWHGHESTFQRLINALDDPNEALPAAVSGVNYVLYGHSHQANSERLACGLHLVNPGALHRATVHSVATIDLDRDLVTHWIVDDQAEDNQPLRRLMIL